MHELPDALTTPYGSLGYALIAKDQALGSQMKSPSENRREKRIKFDRGIKCRIMAIDGTWQRACVMQDASDHGAKLMISGSIQGLPLQEFFLVLSSTGLAYRRCALVWVNGEDIGVTFLRNDGKRVPSGEQAA